MAPKYHVDNKFNDRSEIRINTQVDVFDENLDNIRFVKAKSLPAVIEHLTPEWYVDNAISNSVDPSLLL